MKLSNLGIKEDLKIKNIYDYLDISMIPKDIIDEYCLLYKFNYKIPVWLQFLYYYTNFDMDDMKRIIMINISKGLDPLTIYAKGLDPLVIYGSEDYTDGKFFQDLMEFVRICAKTKSEYEKILNDDNSSTKLSDRIKNPHNENLNKYEEAAIIMNLRHGIIKEEFYISISRHYDVFSTDSIAKLNALNNLLKEISVEF